MESSSASRSVASISPPTACLTPPTTSHTSDSEKRRSPDTTIGLSTVYQEFGLTASETFLPPPRVKSPNRLSNLSSISEWSRQTINVIQTDDLSWFRLEGAHSRQQFRPLPDCEDDDEAINAKEALTSLTALPPIVVEGGDSEDSEKSTGDLIEVFPVPQRHQATKSVSTTAMVKEDDRAGRINRISNWRKWVRVAVLANLSLTTSMGELMLAPAAPELGRIFNLQSPLLRTFVVSVYVLGFALRPPLLRPLGDWWGRLKLLHISNLCFVAFNIGCGFSPSIVSLLILRFHAGALGTACLLIGPAVVSDLFPFGRGATKALVVLEVGRLAGWFIGPITGGVIMHYLGWRWIFWILAAVGGLNTLLALLFVRDRAQSFNCFRRKGRASDMTSIAEKRLQPPALSPTAALRSSIVEPCKMLFTEPLVAMSALSSMALWAAITLVAIALPFSYSATYRFIDIETGFVYVAPGIGMIFGFVTYALLSDCMVKRRKRATRLTKVISALTGTAFASGGVALYGWATAFRFPWIVALVGLGLSGTGTLILTMSIQSSLSQTYTVSAQRSSALAANSVMTSLASGLVPLSGLFIYDRFRMGWGNTLLSGILSISILSPIVCALWAGKVRWPWVARRLT